MKRAQDRAFIVMACVILGYCGLALRAVPLTLAPSERVVAQGTDQFNQLVQLQTPRGEIFARDGGLLAATVEMPSLYADPSRLDPADVEPIAAALSEMVATPYEVLVDRLSRHTRRGVVLAKQVSPDVIAAAQAMDPGGVFFERSAPTRFYPSRELAASTLGVVGWDGRGVAGLEQHLDEHLHGVVYQYVEQRDRRGRSLSSGLAGFRGSYAGDAITLTIDRFIQQAAEEALDEIVERSDPLAATAVVLSVETGEILAMANRPTLNPNIRAGRDTSRLQNYAVAWPYEPGSVLKPFVAALAMDAGVVSEASMIHCEDGAWRVGRRTIHDDHPHGLVTLSEVIKYSSNIGAAKMALDMGAQQTIDGLKAFGFARRTGVSLPHEVGGMLRNPARIKPIELATTSYGQGMTSTTLQLAAAAAALGNHGALMRPYLVSEIRDAQGHIKRRNKPQRVEQAVSPESADAVMRFMATVLEDGGTGTRARIPGYTAAGKTGTAQKVEDGRYSPTARVAVFMGLAPAVDPEIAIVVLTDTPRKGSRYGGTVSGPAFSYIGERALRYLGVPPDRLEDEEPEAAELDEPEGEEDLLDPMPPALLWTRDGGLELPDLRGLSMRDALVTLDGAGLELSISGSGIASAQIPSPGAVVRPGDRVEVRFQ